MPARGRRRAGEEAGPLSPNLTPLLDVVLQLITFFMMLIHFGTRIEGATRLVRLPVAPAALPGADLAIDRLTVALDEQGRLLVGDEARDGPAAEAWWKSQAETRRGGLENLGKVDGDELPTVVVVRADRKASYGTVRRTLAAAQQHGFAHFSLVVLRSPES
jgi:biopolymer transport protein ExbD